MVAVERRNWVAKECEDYIQSIASKTSAAKAEDIQRELDILIEENQKIHERDCFNLNPATNAMNPRAEAALSARLGSRPSLGYPGDKYEMGLEAIEKIEVIAAELCAEVFEAQFAEIRVASGAIANLYGFMALAEPGDAIIVPPATIGGHVTHHSAGCAGLYGLDIHEAPVDTDGYSVDINALAELAQQVKPKIMTIGGSLNLFPHPVAAIREIADRHGAKVLFDAAHQCGIIAGKAWANPLREGAHLMTMSTYKSLGGPASGLIVSNDADIAERLDKIAFPGMTANFDVGKTAALAMTMLDWREFGSAYAKAMIDTAQALAASLDQLGIPVFASSRGFTQSHQFAVDATGYGGGQAVSKRLRKSGLLTCGIGLPIEPVEGDLNGLRLGTPEIVRWGMSVEDMPKLAGLIHRAMTTNDAESLAAETANYRKQFSTLHYIRT